MKHRKKEREQPGQRSVCPSEEGKREKGKERDKDKVGRERKGEKEKEREEDSAGDS